MVRDRVRKKFATKKSTSAVAPEKRIAIRFPSMEGSRRSLTEWSGTMNFGTSTSRRPVSSMTLVVDFSIEDHTVTEIFSFR